MMREGWSGYHATKMSFAVVMGIRVGNYIKNEGVIKYNLILWSWVGRNHTGEDRGVKCDTEKGWCIQVIILTRLGWKHSSAAVVVPGCGVNG